MAIISMFLVVILLILCEKSTKTDSTQKSEIWLNYQRFAEVFVLPVFQEKARCDDAFCEFPETALDVYHIQCEAVDSSTLIYTFLKSSRCRLANDDIEKIVKSAICEKMAQKLQVDYAWIRTHIKLSVSDLPETTRRKVTFVFSDSLKNALLML